MNEIRARLAKNLQIARKNLDMSRATLAEAINCHKNTIYLYENGEREIPSEQLTKIADVLRGGNWLWFFQEQEAKPAALSSEEKAIILQAAQLLAHAAKLASVLHCSIDDFVTVPTQSRLHRIKRDYHLAQAEESSKGVA